MFVFHFLQRNCTIYSSVNQFAYDVRFTSWNLSASQTFVLLLYSLPTSFNLSPTQDVNVSGKIPTLPKIGRGDIWHVFSAIMKGRLTSGENRLLMKSWWGNTVMWRVEKFWYAELFSVLYIHKNVAKKSFYHTLVQFKYNNYVFKMSNVPKLWKLC